MNTILELAVRNAVAAALLAGAVLFLSLFIKRPAVRNALWMIVLIRLFLPPIWNIFVPGIDLATGGSNQGAIQQVEQVSRPAMIAAKPVAEVLVHETPLPSDLRSLHPSEEQEEGAIPHAALESEVLPAETFLETEDHQGEVQHASGESPAPRFNVSPAAYRLPPWLFKSLIALWIAGSSTIMMLACGRIRRFQRGLKDAVLAPAELQLQASILARRLGLKYSPAVWLAPGRVPPMLWMPGLTSRSARLIFPRELFFRLDVEQRGALLIHELAHLRRGDPWVRWLELLTSIAYWWHPLLGLIRKKLRSSEEQCCDAWVVATFVERKSYATALVETVGFLDGPDVPASPELATGAGPAHDLKGRVTMIMQGSMRCGLTRFGVIAILGVALAALAFGPAFSQDSPREPKPPTPSPAPKGYDAPRDEPGRAPRGGIGNDEFAKAREELERARQEAEAAMHRVRQAEERLHQLIGRGQERRPADREDPRRASRNYPPGSPGDPGAPGGSAGVPGGPPPGGFPGMSPSAMPGMMGGAPGQGGPNRQMQEMQKQLDEMRRMIEVIRDEMRRGRGGPGGRGGEPATPATGRPGPGVAPPSAAPFGGGRIGIAPGGGVTPSDVPPASEVPVSASPGGDVKPPRTPEGTPPAGGR